MASPADVVPAYAGEVHGELITDGDSSTLTVIKLYEDGSDEEISSLGARQKLYITDISILSETGGDFALVADSAAAGLYIAYGALAAAGIYEHTFETPFVCPAGVIPKFQGAATNRNVCLIQGFIKNM